eukprot:3481357-Alexandrium_andersonii.AAC.1
MVATIYECSEDKDYWGEDELRDLLQDGDVVQTRHRGGAREEAAAGGASAGSSDRDGALDVASFSLVYMGSGQHDHDTIREFQIMSIHTPEMA